MKLVQFYCLCYSCIICLHLHLSFGAGEASAKAPFNAQVQSGLFGSDLEKVSVYGVDKGSPSVAPVCLLYTGNHYDLLLVSK